MWRILTLSAGLVLLAFAANGGAGHGCNGLVTEAGPFYIDDRDIQVGGIWIYQESNGVPGLQSGGAGPAEPAFAAAGGLLSSVDTCSHANPDTLLF
jgi:hypothetical protein